MPIQYGAFIVCSDHRHWFRTLQVFDQCHLFMVVNVARGVTWNVYANSVNVVLTCGALVSF
jgi:hypothetical protein